MQTAASQVAILYVMVAVGFAADKLHVFTEKAARAANDLMFYIVTPCIIIDSFINTEFSGDTAKGFAVTFTFSVASYLIGIAAASPFFNGKKETNGAVYKFAAIYGNVGYMALPLASAVLGAQGVFYCSGGIIVLNILAFTHGVWLMNKGRNVKFNLKSIILNPGVISVLIGLPFFLFSIKLPAVISQPVSFISDMNTPFAMIIFGTYIANTDLKTIFKNYQPYLVSAIRLIFVPVVILLLCRVFSLSPMLTTACMISAAVPSANNTVMFAAKYNKDTGAASKTIAINSFLSVITLPVMIALSKL